MPRTSKHVIEDVVRELRDLKYENEFPLKDLVTSISVHGGAKQGTVNRYVKLMKDLKYIESVGAGVFKFTDRAKEVI